MLQHAMHRYVPRSLQDPVGLTGRIVRSRSADAYFAAATAALGVLVTPVDVFLQAREHRLYATATPPRYPIIFVCGAPRSGTTLVAQMLIRHLPVAYITNLSSVFPRSPVSAMRLFRARSRNNLVQPRSYYGRTAHFWGPNDALQIWDRWMGVDRANPPSELSQSARVSMRQFFGAVEHHFDRPVLNKNNSLNVVAHLVADALETAHFVCVTRDPLYLAQSLLKARENIHGSRRHCYGVPAPTEPNATARDPFRDVCRQALFHDAIARRQVATLGTERFMVCSYERFCENPTETIAAVGETWLGCSMDHRLDDVPPLRASAAQKLSHEEFERLERTLARLSPPTPGTPGPGGPETSGER